MPYRSRQPTIVSDAQVSAERLAEPRQIFQRGGVVQENGDFLLRARLLYPQRDGVKPNRSNSAVFHRTTGQDGTPDVFQNEISRGAIFTA